MTQTLILLQGIPGSGKSTVARMMASAFRNDGFGPQYTIRSTDEFWGDDYNFEPTKLGFAHKWNHDRVRNDMMAHFDTIFVDNTNIKRRAILRYLELAKLFDYDVQVIRVTVPLELALERNSKREEKRRVPDEVIIRMHGEMEDLLG